MPSNLRRSSSVRGLDEFLRPRSIAVIGASGTPGKVGYTVLKNILSSGYGGGVYPVNPKDPEVLGLKAYRSVLNVPAEVDAAVVVVPAKLCIQVAEECGRKGVKGMIIITSGFSEVGRKDIEDESSGPPENTGRASSAPTSSAFSRTPTR